MSEASALLREPWRDLSRQLEGATFGIWCFVASELLLFGGMFLAYAVYRMHFPQDFAVAARETNIVYGTANTAVLLTSSLTMALAAQAAQGGLARRLSAWFLAATAALGIVFLVLKGFEYAEDIEKGLVPGPGFALKAAAAQLFFALYWIMTGIHAIHLTIGIALVGRLALLGGRGRLVLRDNPQVEITALYWHFVDVIWIVLYPLLYLAGRSS
jgi:cytochrome c oxidase subunit 3